VATRWRTDGAIVELRDLKYAYQRGADGKAILDLNGKKVPTGRPKEKGIDVLCALACVREVRRREPPSDRSTQDLEHQPRPLLLGRLH